MSNRKQKMMDFVKSLIVSNSNFVVNFDLVGKKHKICFSSANQSLGSRLDLELHVKIFNSSILNVCHIVTYSPNF